MQVPQHFDVSLTPSATTTISVMQGDGLRLLVAHLKKDAEPWPVPEGISAGLSYELSDQAPGYYDQMNDGTPACVINGDQISVLLEPMLTECPGPVRASIILRDPDGVQIATFPFHILVEQVPGLVHAENMRAPVHRFDGKIYYGGVAGIPQPLGLGNGLQAEKQKDGSLLLVADGNTPVRGVDYWTAADQEAIVQQVIAALGTPVFGRVDGENNIILTGELADGTYTLKYEDGEGNVTEIGTLSTGVEELITENIPIAWEVGLKLGKNDNNHTTISVVEGTANDSAYAASQHIEYNPEASYTIAMSATGYRKISVCCYDEAGDNIGYLDSIIGENGTDTGPASIQFTPVSGTKTFRFRLWFGYNGTPISNWISVISLSKTYVG